MTKLHTTNYQSTFIQVAEDCAAESGLVPPLRAGKMTVAGLQHAMIAAEPYVHTSDDVIFACSAAGQALSAAGQGLSQSTTKQRRQDARGAFFSKGQACMRASALGKQYGWGVHSDAKGRVALVAVGTDRYQKLAADPSLKQLKAMRSKRA